LGEWIEQDEVVETKPCPCVSMELTPAQRVWRSHEMRRPLTKYKLSAFRRSARPRLSSKMESEEVLIGMQVIRGGGDRRGRITHCGIASKIQKKIRKKFRHTSPLLALKDNSVSLTVPHFPSSGLVYLYKRYFALSSVLPAASTFYDYFLTFSFLPKTYFLRLTLFFAFFFFCDIANHG
jgi:hypothetical protein